MYSEAATKRYSLGLVFLKSRENHWKILVKEFAGIFRDVFFDYFFEIISYLSSYF